MAFDHFIRARAAPRTRCWQVKQAKNRNSGMATMFERYGGFATVSKVVMAFYDKALDSDVIGVYFENVDMPALIDHQTNLSAR
jgi:hypothetical protein